LFILAPTISSYAKEEIEDLIYIAESKSKIIAIIEGSNKISFSLRPKEKVLWRGSKGYLGALITNHRFFVISTSSGAWKALPLKGDESEKGVASLSEYIALLVTGDRAICFNVASNQFIEIQLPIHDELLAAKVKEHVAVVVTSSRAFGLGSESLVFNEIHLSVRETLKEINITSSRATIHTSDRLLTFDATGSTWTEHRL
jgi:hypothetical protein